MFKKAILILIVLLFAGFNAPIVNAEEPVTLTCISNKEKQGYLVTIKAKDTKDVVALQFTVLYDNQILSVDSIETGDIFNNNLAPVINAKEDGKIFIIWDSLDNLPNEGTVLKIHFKALKKESSTLTIAQDDSLVFSTEEFVELPVIVEECQINKNNEKAENTDNNQNTSNNANQITIQENNSIKLEAQEKEGITWISSNEEIATVDENGIVSALKDGKAIITAESEDGSSFISYEITVTNTKTSSTENNNSLLIIISIIAGVAIISFITYLIYAKKFKGRQSNEAD